MEVLEAISASAAALAAVLRRGTRNPETAGAGLAGSYPAPDAADPPLRDDVDPWRDGADPLRERADAYLDGLVQAAEMEARFSAVKVHLAAGYATTAEALAPPASSPQEHTAQEMSVTAEVACALAVSERSAGALISEALALTTGLPLTLAALQSGTVSWQHARILCDETTGLEPSAAAALEAHFLDPDAQNPARGCPVGNLTSARFRAKARSWRERHHPVSMETRHHRSAADRRVEYVPDRDGMAWLSAYLPADTAAGIWDRTTTAARILQGPSEPRTLTQLRADVAAAWLLTAGSRVHGADGVPAGSWRAGDVPSPAAQVLVTVPVFSLLGLTGEPAVLDGYGPIPPSMARRLVADGASSFLRVLTDPRSGAPLEIGRSSYRIPKAMRQWLRLRDGRCPFPGCNNHSLDTDADHLLAWSDGGGTGISNLGQPCRRHHRLKHTTAWRPEGATAHEPPGWTSPTGRHYPSEQPDWELPQWPSLDLQERANRQDWEDWETADSLRSPDFLDAPEQPAGEDWQDRETPDWHEPPDWPVAPEPPCSLDRLGIHDVDGIEGLGPPRPADPFPDWAHFMAA
ncbi:HNH endonuclease signature motif containing protein [Arthrobacter sp. 24S4-2]|uniref:HNH endonuclease signature motif containing protein n=1 Tax=Arthrobacter sp. 24S4-2 TaxID=2575374 RepID=UPI0020C78315|nr:HNH endonuclease signature motif containing protein [Arthrobacter sp. 24S4-2]